MSGGADGDAREQRAWVLLPELPNPEASPSSRTLKDEETGHKVTVRQKDHAPAELHPTHLYWFARYDLGHFGTGHVGLIPTDDRSDTKEEPSRRARRARKTMPNTDESRAAESIAPSPLAQAAASAGTIVRGRLLEPTNALEDQSGREQLEALQRHVVALQRISSLGVLAGGVFHELNNTLTPIIDTPSSGCAILIRPIASGP